MWAEIDRLRAELEACYSAIQVANDRQEQTEETLRVTDDSLFRAVEDAQKAEAALARVRAEIYAIDDGTMTGDGWTVWNRITNALDGAE